MKKPVIASGLCFLLSGCIGFKWTSKIDDGAIYELNREMYIAEEDGLILTDIGTCVRLIALSGISSALRPKNMIKRIF